MTKKMTPKEFAAALAATNEVVRDLWAKGGPMRPVSGGSYFRDKHIKLSASEVLEAEQQRLMRTWRM